MTGFLFEAMLYQSVITTLLDFLYISLYMLFLEQEQKMTLMRPGFDILPALKDGDSRIVAEHHATARAGSCFLEEP